MKLELVITQHFKPTIPEEDTDLRQKPQLLETFLSNTLAPWHLQPHLSLRDL